MAGLLPILRGNATNGPTGPLASSDDEGAALVDFAAVLSGIFDAGRERKTADVPDFGNEPVPTATASPALADMWQFDRDAGSEMPPTSIAGPPGSPPAGNRSEAPRSAVAKASRSGLSNSLGSTKTSLTGGETPVALPIVLPNGATGIPTVRQPKFVVWNGEGPPGEAAGLVPEPVAPARNVETAQEDFGSASGLVSEAALGEQLSNTGLVGPHRAPTTGAASGENPGGGGAAHIRGHRHSGEPLVPADEVPVGSGAPVIGLPAIGDASPRPIPTITPPVAPVGRSPSADTAVTGATGTGLVDGARPAMGPRFAPADPDKGQTAGADRMAEQRTAPALSATAVAPEKLVVRSDPAPETQALALHGESPQAASFGSVSSVPSGADKALPAAPADQIAPALVSVLQNPDGHQIVTVRLQPAELGQVQIRVDQTVMGAAHIAITAERPETLQLLQREEPRLQQLLDQAGVLSTGRTVSFQVATPEQIGATASRPDSMETGAGASGQGQSGGTWRQNEDAPNDFGRGPGADQGQNRPRWFRAGLDITA